MQTITKQRAEKIARNINAMDTNYQYCDNSRAYRFWSNLEDKLNKILASLSTDEKVIIKALCHEEEAKYFNLV
ncbi:MULTISPECIES: hypothetical protein [unclassified Kaistella]|uniref:hypothetical protein n=1 Tax=unclassified Kaistella TaxID=2762626 RepID=UPI0027355355|nr:MULTISPECIES: hypothetical protein [unclassified Kaistella]MDP2452652.1 hypothetical protein [Kaistella sp. SH11-4b]MDP2455561.1 hypothetical protein [Kaistella sp. SH40-3]MDP2458465.1 hypothetical protein [Kaistella sp. SH19-2b]